MTALENYESDTLYISRLSDRRSKAERLKEGIEALPIGPRYSECINALVHDIYGVTVAWISHNTGYSLYDLGGGIELNIWYQGPPIVEERYTIDPNPNGYGF